MSSPVDTIREALDDLSDQDGLDLTADQAHQALDVLVREAAAQREALREIATNEELGIQRCRNLAKATLAAGGGTE